MRYRGVQYLSLAEEKIVRERQTAKESSDKEDIAVDEHSVELMKDVTRQIQEWLDERTRNPLGSIQQVSYTVPLQSCQPSRFIIAILLCPAETL